MLSVIRASAPILLLGALACAPRTAPDQPRPVRAGQSGFQFVPTRAGLLGTFLRMRVTAIPGPTTFLVCGADLAPLLTEASIRAIQAHINWDARSRLERRDECGTLVSPTGVRTTLVRVEQVSVGADSAVVVARSLRSWDGRTPDTAQWLTERVTVEYRGTGIYRYLIEGWDFMVR